MVNNLMHVPIEPRGFETKNHRLSRSPTWSWRIVDDSILFSEILRIVGAQLVILSFSTNP